MDNKLFTVMMAFALLISVCLTVPAMADGDKKMAEEAKEAGEQIAVIKTKHGNMTVEFFNDVAPGHVKNFVDLAKKGFYNGTIFHRIIPGFMIQGGDPTTKDLNAKANYGTGGPGYNIDAEFSSKKHKRGVLSMARSQDPNSAGSQFFVVVADSLFLDGQYTVFGEVTEGMEVADKIVSEPKDSRDNPNDRIEMTVVIETK